MSEKYNKSFLVELLKEKVLTVTFEKKDGSIRTLNCTLNENYLPKVDKKTKSKSDNPNILNVWDTDTSGWKAMIIDNIKSIG